MAYRSISAGYLVENHKVLLVHNKRLDKWTPPGGHMEENETPDQAVMREWKEELDLDIEVIPAHESAFVGDANSTPVPLPFYIDLEREGFDVPGIGYFFYVKLKNKKEKVTAVLKSELHNFGWFSEADLADLSTFEQVRALSKYAIKNYPK